MAHDVFISYSSKDKPTADAVCARIEAKGLRCWIAPRDVTPGADWGAAIIDGINGSRAMVLVYSQNANESPQIRREIERAVAKGLAIIPLRIEDVPMSKSLEYFISTPHWLDAITPPLEQHLDYLADTLKRLVHPSEERTPVPRLVPDPVPVPNPVPKPWIKPAIVAGAALVIVATMLIYFLSDGGAVDSRLVGAWTGSTVVNNVPLQLSLTLDQNGNGTMISSLLDHGRFTSGRGGWTMTNSRGQTLRGTYSFTSANEMSMTGPLGTATWRRDAASPPDPAGRLLGKWTLGSVGPDGLPVTTTLIFSPDTTYSFDASSVDSIVVQATDGKWQARSAQTSKINAGTYQMTGPGAFTITSPQGVASWTRR